MPVGPVRLVAALDAEDVGPLVGEVVAVLRRLQQLSTSLSRLSASLSATNAVTCVGRRQRAGDVEVDAADELLVGAQLRRHDAEFLPLLAR